jgi:hypothetical protein
MRRVILALVVAVTASAIAVTVALGQTGGSTESLKVTIKPNRGGTKKHPVNVTLNLVTETHTVSGPRPVIKLAIIKFAQGSVYNGGKFKHCSQATLDSRGPRACPKGSLVGTGLAKAFAAITVQPKVTAFNGPGKNHIELFLTLSNPLVHQALQGTITKTRGKYGLSLRVPIPPSLRNVAGIAVKLFYFQTKITKKGFLQAAGACPKNHKAPFAGTFFPTKGAPLVATTFERCRP